MTARKAYIYKMVNPKGKVYIGSTIRLKARIREYRSVQCRQQYKLFNSIKKYGFEKHSFQVICECTTDDIYAQESYYGTLYNVLSVNGLNLRLPKHGDKYQAMSDEMREAIRIRVTGTKHSPETILKLKNRKYSVESREKMRVSQTGKKRTEESINKNRIYWTGRKHTEEAKANMRIAQKDHRIPLHALEKAYDKTGKKIINIETGEIFRSLEKAARTIGKQGPALSIYLRGIRPNKTPFRFLESTAHCYPSAV